MQIIAAIIGVLLVALTLCDVFVVMVSTRRDDARDNWQRTAPVGALPEEESGE